MSSFLRSINGLELRRKDNTFYVIDNQYKILLDNATYDEAEQFCLKHIK